jgi:hypothetical protein
MCYRVGPRLSMVVCSPSQQRLWYVGEFQSMGSDKTVDGVKESVARVVVRESMGCRV